jgi:hypothetical protein
MSEPRFPWRVGDELADGWAVRGIERHPEFVVVKARKGEVTTKLEVIYHEGAPHPWATGRYRVQPALGEEPPVELLAEVLEQLRSFDGQGFGEPFVKRARLLEGETPAGPDGPGEPKA